MYDEHRDAIHTGVRRAFLTGLDDSGPQQLVNLQRFVRDTPQKIVRLQHAGLSSAPSYGEGVVVGLGGRSDNLWALGFENPGKRPTGLPAGATALYDEAGNIIKLIGKSVVMSFVGSAWSAECKGFTLSSDGVDIVLDPKGAKVYLGGKTGASPVATAAGYSSHVFAVV